MVVLQVFAQVIGIVLFVLQAAMLLRAILPLFASEDNRLLVFVTYLTEPIIIPFRALFDRMGWFQHTPIDMPFMAAVLALYIILIFI